MTELAFSAADYELLRTHLLADDVERCAMLFARQYQRADGQIRLLVREIWLPKEADYLCQSSIEAQLSGAYVAMVTKEAARRGESLVFVHSHLGDHAPQFSRKDDLGENMLAEFLARRHPSYTHLALVLSAGGLQARTLGTTEMIKVVSVGSHRRVLFDPSGDITVPQLRYDRHVRAFGRAGQQEIQKLHVGIVGLGGTGSLVAQQLGHLGVKNFTLIDPDIVDETNLNRVAGANQSDIGRFKVDVAKRQLLAHNDEIVAKVVQEDVVRARVANLLRDVDVIFSCTDSHGSRSVIQQVAYQYLIPCIDIGSIITIDKEQIQGIFGRVQLLSPGEPCLWCSSLLDSEEIRRDLMTETERRTDPYIPGSTEPAPSVIWLNGVVVSMAVGMFMSLVTEAPMPGRHWQYHAHRTTLRKIEYLAREDCFICSKQGVLAKGQEQPLFARQD